MDILQLQHILDRLELQYSHLPLNDDYRKLKKFSLESFEVGELQALEDEISELQSDIGSGFDDIWDEIKKLRTKK